MDQWPIRYERDQDGWTGGLLMLARIDISLRGWVAVKVSNHCIVTKIAGISDLELYGWLELLIGKLQSS